MKNNTEIKYCQTCGIPLNIDYASLTGGRNEEYCDYCLKNGVKLYDFSMDYLSTFGDFSLKNIIERSG